MKLALGDLHDKINSEIAAGLVVSLRCDNGAIAPVYSESATTEQKAAAQAIIDATTLVGSKRAWTPYEFYAKFTVSEKAALVESADETVKGFVRDMQLYQVVYPDSSEMEAAMGYLVSIGILSESRKQEILS